MASRDTNSTTMEMGNSDQVLVAAKKKKRTTYIIGGIVMLVVIGAIIAVVVVFSGNEGGSSDEQTGTTEGPTTPVQVITEPTSTTTEPPLTVEPTTAPPDTVEPTTAEPTTAEPTTAEPTTAEPTTAEPTTEEPITQPPEPGPINLEDLNDGAYSPSSFNATWVSGDELVYLDQYSNLMRFNLNAAGEQPVVLVSNASVALQSAPRSTELSPDGTVVVIAHDSVPVYRHSFLAHYTAVTVPGGVEQAIGPEGVADPVLQNFLWGPVGTASAFVYLNDVYYKPSLTAAAQRLTTSGQLYVLYNGIPDWVYEEEVFSSSMAMWFSPLGTYVSFATFNDTDVRVMQVPHYGVPGSQDDQYTRHTAIRYPKAGTINPTVSVTIYNVNTGIPTTVEAPESLEEPILLSVKFVTETTIAVVWANRVQNEIEVYLCTHGQTDCNEIFSHSEPNGWIDNNPLIFNAAGTSFVTILPFVVNGAPWKQVVQVSQGATPAAAWTIQGRTNTANTVAEILSWGDDNVVWYKATAVEDTAQQHLYTVTGAGVVSCFTCGIQHSSGVDCLYNDAALSPDGGRVTVTCAGPAVPEVYLYNANGVRGETWEDNAAVAEVTEGRNLPTTTRLWVPVQSGLPDAQVLVQHPANVETLTNVPLLVYVYAGPDSAQVTHSWAVDWGSTLVARWNISVAHIDGRGSGLKGVNNLFALNRQLGTIEIEDQIAVTRYLQENLPYVDANRTCIWGWSYGGYASTLALARGGDVFRCAMAVAPVTDWRYYDTIYTERYMDVPANNTAAYAASSLLNPESVEALRDKRYMLMHGTEDDNVHYQHAMLFSRLLQLYDIYFEQMSYTDEDHGLVGVRPHLYHTMEKFLQENML